MAKSIANGSKLTKADAGKTKKIDALDSGAKLTKADAGRKAKAKTKKKTK